MRVILSVLLLWATPAWSYVGPGPGLSMLGSAVGLIAAVGFALLVVLAYPIRLLILKLRRKKKDGE